MREVSVPWRLLLALLARLPQGALSRGWGWLADREFPAPLQGKVNRGFARVVGVELEESELPPEGYPSLSDFFVRRLRPGVRNWPQDPRILASPVDGVVGSCGILDEGSALQAKGLVYSAADLVGSDRERWGFRRGLFLTIYLSPRHYHRIHAPIEGALVEAHSIPGRLLPVNLPAVRSIPELFPRNERLVACVEGEGFRMALVAVGAYNVGRISAAFEPGWAGRRGRGITNLPGARAVESRAYSPPLPVRRGEEFMAFHLGSTVVLLLEPLEEGGALPAFAPGVAEGVEIRLGAPLLAPPATGPGSSTGRGPG